MPDICLGLEVHQPYRIDGNFRPVSGKSGRTRNLFRAYFDQKLDKAILKKVSAKCYTPANGIMLENIDRFKGEQREFKVVFSISGVLIEQLERWAPDVLDSFKKLADSGCVEFADQTYYHSLSSLFSAEREEFVEQVHLHREMMRDLFGFEPRVFENTEFVYNNSIVRTLAEMGYKGVFTEGAERLLEGRSPNHVYRAQGTDVAVLLRNYRLSDDIAFRFSAVNWPGWPLTADNYASWLAALPGNCVNIFIDYETFGEHQWPETGIFEFLRWLPREILSHRNLWFKTASEVISSHPPVGTIDVDDFHTVSWADVERSTNAWLGNDMQRTCFHAIRKMEPYVKQTRDEDMLRIWRCLQISDHLYYMYTEPGASGMVHGYFSSQPPVKAFWTLNRILSDLQERVSEQLDEPCKTSAFILRLVPPEKTFHFHEGGRYIHLSAHSLEEFEDALTLASDGSILFHMERSDFARWIREVVGDDLLAGEMENLDVKSAEELRWNLLGRLHARLNQLRAWKSGQ